jgi:phage antirepressor YoqD-like protein
VNSVEKVFDDVVIRVIKKEKKFTFCADHVAKALKLANPEKEIMDISETNKDFKQYVIKILGVNKLFVDYDFIVKLVLRADGNTSERFLKWLIGFAYELALINLTSNETIQNSGSDVSKITTTQIAKMYGMSAKELNKILYGAGVQYKVNDQWVLYYQYQNKDFQHVERYNKKVGERDVVLHSYWTEKGMNFIEAVLQRLGHKKQPTQMSIDTLV